jgi:CRISPR/Cas system-associated endonuclease Cas1
VIAVVRDLLIYATIIAAVILLGLIALLGYMHGQRIRELT